MDYKVFCDDEAADPKADFTRQGVDIVPVAQPEFSTRVTRLAEAEALMKVLGDPRVDGGAILRQYVTAVLNDSEKAATMVPQEPQKTPEQILQLLEQQKMEFMNQADAQIKKSEVDVAGFSVETARIDLETAYQKLEKAKFEAANPPQGAREQ